MGEFDGVYRNKHSKELVVVRLKDPSHNSYLVLSLDLFNSTMRFAWLRLSLAELSNNYIRTEAEKKIEALYHIKEKLNESNSIR